MREETAPIEELSRHHQAQKSGKEKNGRSKKRHEKSHLSVKKGGKPRIQSNEKSFSWRKSGSTETSGRTQVGRSGDPEGEESCVQSSEKNVLLRLRFHPKG